jgi:hypothetical protein
MCCARGVPQVDQRVFAELLLETQPPLGLHLAALGPDNIICGIMASQWLLTLFVHALDDEATASLWDVLFKERDRRVLFAGCLVHPLTTPTSAHHLPSLNPPTIANELLKTDRTQSQTSGPHAWELPRAGDRELSVSISRAGE